MSATNRGAVRSPEDFYATPGWCTRAILPHLPLGGAIVDAGSGRGAILAEIIRSKRVLRKAILGIEKNASMAKQCEANHGVMVANEDFLTAELPYAALVISNPPFVLAQKFVERSCAMTARKGGTVAMLLRLNWLGGNERADFHRKHPADVHVLSRRPSFCISLTCKSKKACGWKASYALDVARPKRCPKCAGPISSSSTDATEYAWLVWGPGRGGRWSVLDCEPARGAS